MHTQPEMDEEGAAASHSQHQPRESTHLCMSSQAAGQQLEVPNKELKHEGCEKALAAGQSPTKN